MNVNNLINMLLQRNPNISNNPNAKAMIDVIMSNDSVKGEQIANNFCQTYGISKEEAVKQARNFLHI